MMPAAKHGDPQMGVDIHLCMVPCPAPTPTPLPTPHMSVVFDPMDYVPIVGATITVFGMKRATAGTAGKVVHIPPGFPFAPKPPDTEDELFMGSATVTADGDPMSHIAHPVLACQVAGMPSPPRKKKKGGPRAMLAPTVFNLAIPTTVFLGGPPTISMMGMAAKVGFAALGKLAKSAAFKKFRQKVFKDMKPGFLKCTVLKAEPVNILNGEVSVEQQDFSLPGRLPIVWHRSYGSSGTHVGVLGVGWQTMLDLRLEVDASDGSVRLLGPDVGPLNFERLPAAQGDAAAELELMDGARLSDHGDEFRVTTKDDRLYHFPKALGTRGPQGQAIAPIGRISDRCGNALSFEYRAGRAVAITEAAGRRLVLNTEQDRLTSVTLFDPATRTEHTFVRYEYDELGRLVAVIDALGAPYRFDYGSGPTQHHMVRHTDRNGLSFHYAFAAGPEDAQRVVHAWGDHGLYDYTFEYLDELKERRITDSLGHVTLIKLDERELPISEIDPLGGMTVYEYDDCGRTTAVVDPGGRRTEYHFDENGNQVQLVRPDGTCVVTAFNAGQKPIAITAPNGATWMQRWDDRGLLVEQTSPLGHTSRYEYDGWGQLIAYTNARGARTVLRFDVLGNLTELQDALQQRTLFAHDVLGHVIAKGDALDRRTHYKYDSKGRLLAVKLPSGAMVQCAYDAEDNLTHYIDESGAQTRLEYFGQGEIAKRIQPDGHTVEYLYDTEERLVGIRNQRGELYQLRRDPLGRITEEIDYWGQSRRYAYDGGGYLTASLDPLGQRIDYTCDPLGRIVQKLLPVMDSQAERPAETFVYDANGNLVATANQHVEVLREFDAEGRLLQEAQKQAQGQTFQLANAFDANGNRIKRETTHSAGAGHVTEFAYDLLDQVIGVRIDGGEPMRLQRDALGQVTREELAPGLSRSLKYNSDGLLTEQSFSTGQQGLFATRYDYDLTGNLTSRHDSVFGKDTYLYDPMGRILKHTDPKGVLHEFFNDPAGDRLITQVSGSGSASTVLGRNDEWRRQGSYQGAHYRFDRAGNLTHKQDGVQLLELAWDANQRLSASRRTGKDGQPQVTTYAYDPLGRRLYKETAGQRIWFGWDGDAMTLDVIDGQAREFTYRPETFEPLAVLGQTAQGQQLGTLHYVNDPNGCPTRLIDGKGQVLWAASYSAWGAVDKLHASIVNNPIRLQGQYEDGETGLHYNRSRYFDSTVGAFVSQDTIGLLGGDNLHQYAPNSFGWIDPRGTNCELTEKLQKLVNQAVNDIKSNPKLARDLMSDGSYRHLKNGSKLYGASFGKAVERRTAQLVAADPDLASKISHTGLSRGPGGKFISSPDFTSTDGKIFDVTTNKGLSAHEKRYGKTQPNYLLYDVIEGLSF